VPAPAGEADPAEPAAEQPSVEHAPADAETGGLRSRAAAAEAEADKQEAAASRAKNVRPATGAGVGTGTAAGAGEGAGQARRRGRAASRRPSGRERHDEKITVYVSAEELMDLEHARLVLRGEHGLAVDRGRIVREAVAVVLADLEARGDASILVRRLRGR
jgi:hypothetical protein